jgi:ferredoxin--NADP+ reductase
LEPAEPAVEAALALVAARKPTYFSYADWLLLDEIEMRRGEAQGRPRVKFTDVDEMLAALEKEAV